MNLNENFNDVRMARFAELFLGNKALFTQIDDLSLSIRTEEFIVEEVGFLNEDERTDDNDAYIEDVYGTRRYLKTEDAIVCDECVFWSWRWDDGTATGISTVAVYRNEKVEEPEDEETEEYREEE